MDERLRRAAQSGNIENLYAVIKDDADVFSRIDQVRFVDTPLHIAAAIGHSDFAMEMMNLQPAFARKLNQDGFSPIHLALQNQQTELVVDFLSVDKDVVRVKGREGYTPLHYVAREGNTPLLSQFLDHCPSSILDLTIRKETALHVAARFNRLEAFKAILECIQKTTEDNQFQRRRILNIQDRDGNSALHIAASINQAQMIELLTKCEEVDRNKVNQSGFTALGILQQENLSDIRESVKILNRFPSRLSRLSETKLTTYIKEMKLETINALLVVFSLVLTMTYQAIFNPPGGLSQGDAAGSSKDQEGKSVVDTYLFLLFFIPNWAAFIMAWGMTLALLSVVAKSIISFLFPLYFLMFFCYGVATGVIAPSASTALVAAASGLILLLLIYYYYICLYRFGK